MRCSLTSLLGLIPLALALDTTSVTFTVPTNHLPQNGNALPPNTHVTLSTLHKSYSTPLTTANTFVFRNVTPGSYLVDTHCTTHAFAPLRLDVSDELTLAVWETYRGNDWDNKGEVVAGAEAKRFELRVLGGKNYFVERPKCMRYLPLLHTIQVRGYQSWEVLIYGFSFCAWDPEKSDDIAGLG
jgi:ER membrane protein complex subunit 7